VGSSIGEKLKRMFIRTAVGIMPLIPLPGEWYRKILVRDSDKRYASGRWAYMKDSAESHRYSIIIGCCEYYKSGNRKILDIGCGEGILQKRVAYSEYVGVDMNIEAIRLAKREEGENTKFILAPAEEYQPCDLYDVIIFNEALYYIKNPMEVLAKYRSFLANNGILIICMFQTNLARKIWKKIRETDMVELTGVRISNDLGFTSVVKVYANSALSPRQVGRDE
jgi:2-polyprenyl-3-methyl-5-hydroxy-6-metoxy-1,4-benzoquinol methylase